MTKIEEIEQENQKLISELNEITAKLKENLNQLKQPTNFKVGKVYKNEFGLLCMFVSKYKHYGFNSAKDWVNGNYWFENLDNGTWQPATTQEWETALIEYAKKQGFKAGVTVDRSDDMLSHINEDSRKYKVVIDFNNFDYIEQLDILKLDDRIIYYKGQWATIVKEEPLMIGGVEVEIKDNKVTIGQYTYQKCYFKSLRTTCRDFNEPITTELLTKIIDKLK